MTYGKWVERPWKYCYFVHFVHVYGFTFFTLVVRFAHEIGFACLYILHDFCILQGLLGGFAVGYHQSTSAKKRAAEIANNHYQDIV